MKTVMATGTFDLLHPGHGLYLQKAKELGGKDVKLVVVVARDSTVRRKKRIPIIGESQRLEMIRMLKPVDEAYLGHPTDMFKIVRDIRPDIIAIGSDQSYKIEDLKKDLKNQKIDCEVERVSNYRKAELDSSCKIIKKIKNSDFTEKSLKDC
ncbi:FAD synthase [Methanobrevibacter arboriphilus]|jgi:FAD synthetase|uniref:FAD synthase n=1 Tax=Methanobrevibacter arboriphilus TaxID=39441 RepID=A0ACA8R627_METAZ|nr:adenylyltransferase/cytidyltransferase family protein [Methanobrevibacter arboriphilus]BBL62821.1 FAD synthase [Methanobrevibacter arboriphilus]GLI12063.1 FAD synthase [Methanobrevibacter arboriphilus]